MNLMNIAVASIVDAHLDQGYTTREIGRQPLQISDHIDRGRSIRASSISTLIKNSLLGARALLAKLKANAQHRKAVEEIAGLNERLLNDIGLTQYDINRLKTGLVSFEDLSAEHRPNIESSEPRSVTPTKTQLSELNCANEAFYELAKCG